MKSKILFLLMLGAHFNAFSATNYQVNVVVTEPQSTFIFPTFEISSKGKSKTSFVDGCAYLGTLSEPSKNSIQLEATMSCNRDGATSRMEMPVFVLNSEAQSASYDLVENGIVMWKYSVEVKPSLKK
ncbi:hypothetical protein R8269_05565 [Vibrio sp. Vb0667]|uniref:hypothetical protein n=1 Tax=Vibrio sp. Vb0667 TaxID=3074629 RepID=UPI00296ADFBD|nr:hypothetical protein [Vibrio sp. Vb0667]MDW3633174.1 hypothetical protein [Vibrio sp. Vb0667]